MNDAGRCVCPEGTTFRNGQCSGGGGTVTPIPPVKQCTLLPGQIRTEDGRCICPRGTELINGECVKDEPPAAVQAAAGPDPAGERPLRLPARYKPHPGRVPQGPAAAVQAAAGPDPARERPLRLPAWYKPDPGRVPQAAGGMPEGPGAGQERPVRDHSAATLPARYGRYAAELPEASAPADQPGPAAAAAAAPAEQQQHPGTVSLLQNEKTPPVRRRGFYSGIRLPGFLGN